MFKNYFLLLPPNKLFLLHTWLNNKDNIYSAAWLNTLIILNKRKLLIMCKVFSDKSKVNNLYCEFLEEILQI